MGGSAKQCYPGHKQTDLFKYFRITMPDRQIVDFKNNKTSYEVIYRDHQSDREIIPEILLLLAFACSASEPGIFCKYPMFPRES